MHRKKTLVTKYYTGPWNWQAFVKTLMNSQVHKSGEFID